MYARLLSLLFTATLIIPCIAFAEVRVALIGGQLIDGLAAKPINGKAVIVEGDRISAIVDAADLPADIKRIELGDATLLPGMIDSHSHPLMPGDPYQAIHLEKSSAYKALKGHQAMLNLLDAGWTTLRIAGDADVFYGNQDVKKLIEEGVLQGPRLYGAAHYLSVTGGGGDINYFSPEQSVIADGLIVDGPEEIRKAIRTEAKYGADWIKVLVTGAFMSVGDDPQNVQFSEEEFQAVMDEANRQGMPVMAHAHATEGIKMAVRLGARSIEHASYLDDEGIRLMRKHGTYFVPTLYVGDYYVEEARNQILEQKAFDDYAAAFRDTFIAQVGKAHRAGVKIVTGVDLGGYDYDPTIYVREMRLLMEAGFTAMESIQATTSVPAEMLGKPIGAIEVGRYADIIAVSGNPLIDISELERVKFVMKGGSVIRNDLR
jgi:imidazolonepropionase-like amidohydrolase